MKQVPTIDKIKKLLQHFKQGHIPTLAEHEVNPGLPKGSRENYLYFTLPVCLNFQRNSPALWKSALLTWNDPKTNYLFFPEKIAKTSLEKVQSDLGKHRLALQKNRHTHIWAAISKTLHDQFNDDPREIFKQTNYDVIKLLAMLQTTHKVHFPYLSGPKLSNYWPYILSHYTNLNLINPHEISIIPDTHVIKSTIHLGLTPTGAGSPEVTMVWKVLLKDSGISPVEVHPVLWNWSRNNFLPEV